jgi:hypothetical protein
MTHSLHRRGAEDELKRDYVVIAMTAKGINSDGAEGKVGRVAEIMAKHNPLFYAVPPVGNSFVASLEDMKKGADTIAEGVYNNEDDLVELLKELKEADLGVSINVSGLFDHVFECCRKAGLQVHTVNTSLGIFGRTELLPSEPYLEIGTLCGHGMVSFRFIEYMVDNIKQDKISVKEAVRSMAGHCLCGIFNLDRAERIISKLAAE